VVDTIAKLAGELAWPAIVLFGFWYMRPHVSPLLKMFRQQLASGAALKFKDFEFKGKDLADFEAKNGSSYFEEPASNDLNKKRHDFYKNCKNLMLIHRVRPTGDFHRVNGKPTFDISIYVIGHKSYGAINDIKEVRYYFGEYFGRDVAKNGVEYIVRNGSENFAVKINAYGPSLCQAQIIFHDGSNVNQERSLDFEGTGYRFDPSVNETDDSKKAKQLAK
jgi:hypothetical protein